MDLQVTPSQRQYADAHRQRLDRLWPAQIPKAKLKKAIVHRPQSRTPTPQEWFASAWEMLDGPRCLPSVREVQDLVCEYFDVPFVYMTTTRRSEAYYLPRVVAMWLCRTFTNSSYPAIGREFRRDHTTIMGCFKQAERLIALNHPIAKDIEILSAKLEGANQ